MPQLNRVRVGLGFVDFETMRPGYLGEQGLPGTCKIAKASHTLPTQSPQGDLLNSNGQPHVPHLGPTKGTGMPRAPHLPGNEGG